MAIVGLAASAFALRASAGQVAARRDEQIMCEIDWNLFENAAILIAAMGDSPCFHDAAVLDSHRTDDACDVIIHIFKMTPEVDTKGFYILEKSHEARRAEPEQY